jgi:hypothetical protein
MQDAMKALESKKTELQRQEEEKKFSHTFEARYEKRKCLCRGIKVEAGVTNR